MRNRRSKKSNNNLEEALKIKILRVLEFKISRGSRQVAKIPTIQT